MILAFIVFGGARLRASYDPLIILLALEGYAFLALGGYGLVRKLMARRGARS